MGIFAVMLLTSTLTMGVHNGINIPEVEDTDGKKGSVTSNYTNCRSYKRH